MTSDASNRRLRTISLSNTKKFRRNEKNLNDSDERSPKIRRKTTKARSLTKGNNQNSLGKTSGNQTKMNQMTQTMKEMTMTMEMNLVIMTKMTKMMNHPTGTIGH